MAQILKAGNSLAGVNMNEIIVLVVLFGVMLFILWCVSCVMGHVKAIGQRRALQAAAARQQEVHGWQAMDGGGIFGVPSK